MPLKVFTVEQAREWDSTVRSFSDYDVYWLSGYVKAFQLHGDGEPLLFYYEQDGVRGINVVMKRDISDDERFAGKIERDAYFDFVTPYGYGGWLAEGDGNRDRMFSEYEEWCRRHHVVSEFVRYHPVIGNHKYSEDSYHVFPLGNTIAMDLSSPETIWANLTSKNRNMVRKASKAGIVIYNGRYPEIYEKFRSIYNETMDKDCADAYYYFGDAFYESVLEDLSTEGQVFFADLDGKIIAASIMLACNGKLNYHLSGSLQEYKRLAPTNLILYKAALWGCANGCKTFHLGGGVGSNEDSLYQFKKSFNRNKSYQFYIGKKIHDEGKYRELCEIRNIDYKKQALDERFFPAYRSG